MIRNCPAGRPLQKDLRVREEMAQTHCTVLRGRQTLLLLYKSSKTNTSMALVYSVTSLAKLQHPGDACPHYGFNGGHAW